MPSPKPDPRRSRFWLLLILLTLCAWLLREYYVLASQVEAPIRGDVRQYVAYAMNLLHHGTFSQVWPGTGSPLPDSFRGPGYPWFLAVFMLSGKTPDSWYWLALHAQAILGALTATLTVLLARQWLSSAWALFAGCMLALWPHHVAATGALLSEVVFGFSLMLALLMAAEALKRQQIGWAMASGVTFSFAALVNPVSLLFPVLVALLFRRALGRRVASVLLLGALLGPGLWTLRGMTIDAPPQVPSRAALNLAQGSWPLYHEAHFQVLRYDNAIAREMLAEIDREAVLLTTHPPAGFAAIAQRMAADPPYYLRWYLLQKPFLLWDWDIRLGVGDVYYHRTRNSPLETNVLLRSIKQSLKALNPILFVLAVLGVAFAWTGSARQGHGRTALALSAFLWLYVTAVHVVFQAEPRYANAYRAVEMILVATALSQLAGLLGRRRSAPAVATSSPDGARGGADN